MSATSLLSFLKDLFLFLNNVLLIRERKDCLILNDVLMQMKAKCSHSM